MSSLGTYNKQPAEVRYWTLNYSCWLDPEVVEQLIDAGTSIVITPATVPALVVTPNLITTDRLRLLVGGGETGIRYKVEVRVLTSEGQVREDEIFFRVLDR